jgi:hypothetical protein
MRGDGRRRLIDDVDRDEHAGRGVKRDVRRIRWKAISNGRLPDHIHVLSQIREYNFSRGMQR